ncbi:Vacuolar iron transporter 1.1 [Tolypocladium ophioglossoides CBS 100239]|uniref:Vacuolar iron transporter 1.1 n=1 Tax=Tolypocladium ophioglossoides (strain CBS 100239) TaxID=1163406 RepID=A0A0L0NAI1_TOLOC|nr:Vacuolar iron transporter 1.1 [Tolypocladium ophioglossoides CBS 100239]
MAYPSESSPLLPSELPVERPFPTAFDSKPLSRDASPSPSTASSSSSSAAAGLSDTLRDIIIGFSDGLTVPFALTAGLSSLGSTKLVIMGGLAELFSGMISMGLGAYLAAATERDHYRSQRAGVLAACASPARAEQRDELYAVLDKYRVSRAAAAPLVEELCAHPDQWVRFKMDFAMRMDEPPGHRACVSGATMGLSYFVGGLIPMVPYFVMARVRDALLVSVAVTVVILLAFGYAKNYVAVRNHRAGVWGALQTLVIGVLAAGTSYVIVKALDRGSS